jgi:hypothetical protein
MLCFSPAGLCLLADFDHNKLIEVMWEMLRRERMTKVLRGVVHGKTIEVSEDIAMWDGQAVDLIVTPATPYALPAEGAGRPTLPKKLPGPPPGWRPGGTATAAGLLAAEWTEEDDRILEQIQAERKAAKWRELPQ